MTSPGSPGFNLPPPDLQQMLRVPRSLDHGIEITLMDCSSTRASTRRRSTRASGRRSSSARWRSTRKKPWSCWPS